MRMRFDNLLDMEREILVLKKPGQRQSEESAERDRRFAERATAIDSFEKNQDEQSRRHEDTAEAVKRSPIVRRSLPSRQRFFIAAWRPALGHDTYRYNQPRCIRRIRAKHLSQGTLHGQVSEISVQHVHHA